jgi:tetratricopeptide (TPR) repeat protein
LSDEVRSWRCREGLVRESAWLTEGISIFRGLLDADPGNLEYKTELARLLTRSGTDEKLKYVNLMKAEELFSEVVELFPNNGEALYRLGHIYYETGEFEKCIECFIKAVGESLSDIRLFRAFATISKAFYHLGEDGKSKNYLEKAIEQDKEHNFTGEINEVRSLITMGGHHRRLVRYEDGVTHFITIDEVQRMGEETDSNGEAVLDLSHFRPSFIGPVDVSFLERKEADVLCYLIGRKNKFVSTEELLNVWEEDEKPLQSTIKSIISKLRRKVRGCIPAEDHNEIIVSKRGIGYRWVCSVPTNIIKHL